VPRNLGTAPSLVHLDTNLSRAFKIGHSKSDSSRTLTLNARAANLLNHTNVAAVSTVVSSPNFTQPIAAESARRIEFGARFAF
jgi:DNA-binding IclR family transcriptional regulator